MKRPLRPGRACRARLVACAAAAVVLGQPAWADYKESYRKGLEAVESGKWREAAQWMREAAAQQASEGERIKLYGVRFEQYLPQYYLGLALFNTGDCQGAVQAWQASEGQGAVRKTGHYKTLVKNRQTCETRLAAAQPAPTPVPAKSAPPTPTGPDPAAVARAVQAAEAQIARADQTAQVVAGLAADPDLAGSWSSDAALGAGERQGKDLLGDARGKLEAGRRKPDLGLLAEARDLAGRAAARFEAVRTNATARREAAALAAQKKAAEELGKTTASSGAAGAPPAELLAAAGAYFSGRYDRAAQVLSTMSAVGGRAGAQVMLFRAATRHALYLIGGRKDSALLQAAQRDVEACRRLDSGFAPDPQFFSPRFREFFRLGR